MKKRKVFFSTAAPRLRVALKNLLRSVAAALEALGDHKAGPRDDHGRERDDAKGRVDVAGLGLRERRRDGEEAVDDNGGEG